MLAVEHHHDPHALRRAAYGARSKRGRAPIDTIAAAATLEFAIDETAVCSDFALGGLDRHTAGESALVASLERKLADLEKSGGRLVTWSGQRDLAAIRIGALRHRRFTIGGASTWQDDVRDAHDDIRFMIFGGMPAGAGRIQDVGASLGGTGKRVAIPVSGPACHERILAELRVLQTMVVYLHLLAERQRSVHPLAEGIAAMSVMVMGRLRTSPHLAAILQSEVFEGFAPTAF